MVTMIGIRQKIDINHDSLAIELGVTLGRWCIRSVWLPITTLVARFILVQIFRMVAGMVVRVLLGKVRI